MSGAAIALEGSAALAEASREIGNGQPATLIRPNVLQRVNPWDDQPQPEGAGDWDDTDPTPDDDFVPAIDFTDGSPTTQPVWAISEAYRKDLIDGTMIRAEDRRVMVEPISPAPTTADKLTIGADTYNILRVDPEAPGGVAFYFVCQCRK
jgi:hypothetical protein